MHNVTRGGYDFLLSSEMTIIVCIFYLNVKRLLPRITQLNAKSPASYFDEKRQTMMCAFLRGRVNSDETIYLFPIWDFNRSFRLLSRTKVFFANSQFQYLD